ncbi:MAG TPA: lipoprotein signal peptidase [Bacteroidia bacterium]|nr:lipoprotein signal peptidase [Bacteroidia bacterium]
MSKRLKIALLVIIGVLFADQFIKIYIKTHFALGEEHVFFSWFKIHFTENPGMAFGLEFGGFLGKLALSVFRIGAAAFGIYYLRQIILKKYHVGYIAAIAFIFAGAVGNILDSMFYGIFFNESYGEPSHFFPVEGGYAGFLHGKVVDMFYFPLVEGHFPAWFPIWGGEEFMFFRPIFNLADASISTGVIIILLFQKRFFSENQISLTSTEEPVSGSEEAK